VGNRAFHGMRLLRFEAESLYGENLFGAEALPKGGHDDLRRGSDPSPSDTTNTGRGILAEHPDTGEALAAPFPKPSRSP
jgi:hypothetical protein